MPARLVAPMSEQLALDLRLRESASFENYLAGANGEPLTCLRASVEALARGDASSERLIYLWGEEGCGKTHLLQAACRLLPGQGVGRSVYVPLALAQELSPTILEGLETAALVCVDDVHCIRGLASWERALFALCEVLRAGSGVLVVAAVANPASLGLTLPDLATRFGWGLVYQLRALTDEQKIAAIQLRARNRGLEISERVAGYVLRRYPRDTHSLFDLLDRIDQASLTYQRRITVPFLRGLES